MEFRYPVNIKYSDYKNELNILENFDYISEAVFSNGREKVKPIEDQIAILKDEIERFKKEELTDKGMVDTVKLWKSSNFKALEDTIQKIFGFRYVIINLRDDNYLNNKDKSYFIDVFTSIVNRYPASSLITSDGFYDKTHSIGLEINISTYFLDALTPGEITSLILHEIGHNIDPALMDISFTQTNIITDYILKRKPSNAEENISKKLTTSGVNPLMWAFTGLYNTFQKLTNSNSDNRIPNYHLPPIQNFFRKIFTSKENYDEWATQKYMDMIQQELNRLNIDFDYINYDEAFADNFARMYGYGAELASALHKLESYYHTKEMNSIKRDTERRKYIFNLIIYALNDIHKTDIHRLQALVVEYDKDINDPNTPKEVKTKLLEDKEKLVAIVKLYTTDFNEFYNRCNQMILDFIKNK